MTEYRCFPHVPITTGTAASKVGAATAAAMQALLTEQNDAGFEFVGVYDVHTEEKAGCLGFVIGNGSVIRRTASVIVFRRG